MSPKHYAMKHPNYINQGKMCDLKYNNLPAKQMVL